MTAHSVTRRLFSQAANSSRAVGCMTGLLRITTSVWRVIFSTRRRPQFGPTQLIARSDGFRSSDFKSAIRNSQSEIREMVEAPRIELGSRSQRRGIYMLSRFSDFSGKPEKTLLNAE